MSTPVMSTPVIGIILIAADLMFVENGVVNFTSSSESDEDTFTLCVPMLAFEDEFIEPAEQVSVAIDPNSLSPNDQSVPPNEVQITIVDNDGNCLGKNPYCPHARYLVKLDCLTTIC